MTGYYGTRYMVQDVFRTILSLKSGCAVVEHIIVSLLSQRISCRCSRRW